MELKKEKCAHISSYGKMKKMDFHFAITRKLINQIKNPFQGDDIMTISTHC